MTETILYLFATVLILGVLRAIIGVVLKGVSDFFGAPPSTGGSPNASQPNSSQARPQSTSIPRVEALKKDPVCGTYLAPSAAIQKQIDGVTYYFCSVECQNKFRAAGKAS